MKKKSIVLTAEQRRDLEALIKAGQAPAPKITRARILLKADGRPQGPRWSNRQIHEALDVGESTVCRARHSFAHVRLQAALNRRSPPQRAHTRKLDGEHKAH